ncbi:MAG: DUF4936 family protein [Caldimonas sp.]
MRELFVWYRVDPRRADAARAAVDAMQRALVAAVPELRSRLLIRRDAGVQTWMETYALPVRSSDRRDGVDAGIEAAIATAALALRGVIDGERHVEAFDVAR